VRKCPEQLANCDITVDTSGASHGLGFESQASGIQLGESELYLIIHVEYRKDSQIHASLRIQGSLHHCDINAMISFILMDFSTRS